MMPQKLFDLSACALRSVTTVLLSDAVNITCYYYYYYNLIITIIK